MEKKKHDTTRSNPPPLSGETPWLVYTHGTRTSARKQCQTFTSMSPLPPNNKSYVKSIPAMRGKSIRGSCNGWLILLRHGQNNCKMFTLFNPVTSQSIELPEFQDELLPEDEGTYYMLISTPDLDDCVFMVLDWEQVFFCRPSRGDSSWVRQTPKVDGITVRVCRAAVLDKVVYGFVTIGDQPTEVRTVASIELDDASNSLTVKSLRSNWPNCHIDSITQHSGLVESCGAIYCVGRFIRHGSHGRDHRYSIVKVWRLDLKEQDWVEVNSLDGRAFFLGEDSCCTWCWGSSEGASDGVPGNCVYYVSEDARDRNNEAVYCYKLHENSTMLLHVCPTLINPCTSLVWLKPQHDSGENRLLEKQGRKEAMNRAETLNQAAISTIVADEELRQQNGMQDSLLNQLPFDLLNKISKKLQLFDYLNCRATCKLFRSLGGPDQNSLPQFVFFKDDYRSSQVLDPFEPSYSSSISLQPSQEPFTIDFIKNGWLLITVDHPLHSRQYFNPFTRERSKYPHLCELKAVKSIGFSTYPTSSDCVTVGFYDSLNIINVYYHQYGDEAWKKWRIVNQDLIFTPVTSGPLYYKGAFYILSRDGHLGEFRLADGDRSWEIYNKPKTNESKDYNLRTSCHLLECNGQLYSVYLGYYGKWFDVFRFNTSKKTWVKVQNIGNYCFFLSHLSSISAETYSATGIRNRIYLPRFRGKNEMLYYCLETCKYGVSGSDDTLEDIFNTTEPLNYCWI